ncbi:MAG: hypothetical protein JSS49_00250 [Planctomycetes bacterium]|nr:hypothetical protein [Planctomycetota bacterium]
MTGSEPTSQTGRSNWLRASGWLCVYVAIAIYASWPLCLKPTSTISIGFEAESTVPLLNVWTLWWNSDRALAGFRDYWNAPIFYPTRGAFAFSEAQPTMIVMAPIVWLTGSRVLAYNLYLLLILTLNGDSSRRLFLRIGHQPWLAFCGGVLCQMLPFVWWQSGVVQLTTLFGIVWTIHCMLNLFELRPEATWKDSVFVGLKLSGAFCLTYWLCNYWGLFQTLVLIPSSIWFWNSSALRLRFWCGLCLSALLAVALLIPFVHVQRSLAKQHQWTREQNLIRDLSAHPRDFLDTPRTVRAKSGGTTTNQATPEYDDWSRIPVCDFPIAARNNVWPLGGGAAKVVLAQLGLLAALATRGRRRWGLFAATLLSVALGLSLGPTVRVLPVIPFVGGWIPYETLQQYVPGFSLIRSPFRFALFVQLALVWLSVEALDLLNPLRWRRAATAVVEDPDLHPALRNLPPSLGSQFWKWSQWVPLVGMSILVIAEVWPPRQNLYECPSTTSTPAWITWLRDNSEPTDAVVCLPFPIGYTVHDYQETSEWMYWGTMHRRPLVNGYSGFFPKEFVDLKELLRVYYRNDEDPPASPQLKLYPWDSPGLKQLTNSPARFAIVKRSFATRDDVWDHPVTKFRWAWVAGDEAHQLDVYEIVRYNPE